MERRCRAIRTARRPSGEERARKWRLRLKPQQVIQADRSSMVTACVCNGMGFTLLTPSLLIDGFVERMPMRVLPLPAARLTRTLTVVSREQELGRFPSRVAELSRAKLVEQVSVQMGDVGRAALTLLDGTG